MQYLKKQKTSQFIHLSTPEAVSPNTQQAYKASRPPEKPRMGAHTNPRNQEEDSRSCELTSATTAAGAKRIDPLWMPEESQRRTRRSRRGGATH